MLKNREKITLLLIFIIVVSMCSIILFTSKDEKGRLPFNKVGYNFLMKK